MSNELDDKKEASLPALQTSTAVTSQHMVLHRSHVMN